MNILCHSLPLSFFQKQRLQGATTTKSQRKQQKHKVHPLMLAQKKKWTKVNWFLIKSHKDNSKNKKSYFSGKFWIDPPRYNWNPFKKMAYQLCNIQEEYLIWRPPSLWGVFLVSAFLCGLFSHLDKPVITPGIHKNNSHWHTLKPALPVLCRAAVRGPVPALGLFGTGPHRDRLACCENFYSIRHDMGNVRDSSQSESHC